MPREGLKGQDNMFKITLQAVIKVLLENNESFAISNSSTDCLDKSVIRFLVSKKDPLSGPFLYNKLLIDEAKQDKRTCDMHAIAMHYDLKNQCIISICDRWYKILCQAKKP